MAVDGVLSAGKQSAMSSRRVPTRWNAARLVLIGLGFIPGGIVIADFLRTGLILRIPSAILAVGTVLSGLISIVMGIILHVIAQRFRELDANLQVIADQIRRGGETGE